MYTYYIMFIIASLLALFPSFGNDRLKQFIWILIFTIFTIFIGLRNEVGSDWQSYKNFFDYVNESPAPSGNVLSYLLIQDIGYVILNWLSAYLGFGIYGVNLVCAAIFMAGLTLFCRKQPLPWLAFTVAIPIFVVSISMGAVRQATALGWVFMAIIAFQENRLLRFLFLIFMAGLFHKSSLIFLGLFFLLPNLKWSIIAIVIISLFGLFLYDVVSSLWRVYVDGKIISEGVFYRLLINAMPTIPILMFWRRWRQFPDHLLWSFFAVLSLISLLLIGVGSAAVDRIAIYFAPWQIVAYSRLPFLFRNFLYRRLVQILVVVFFFIVLFLWLQYATNSNSWVPYKNIIFEG